MLYFDYAATSLRKPDGVAKAVADAILSMGNGARGTHAASLASSRMIYETREMLARLFGAEEACQIAFTMNSTMALNIAIKGMIQPGDHVITTAMEHNSVLRPLYELERQGVVLTILPCDTFGRISYKEMEESFRENTKAVVCTHVSNVTGNVNDIRRIGQMCREHQAYFILDASQSAGTFPIHMQEDQVDVICFTGHKGLLGPQGTGGLCVKKGVAIRPLLSGGSGIHSFSKEQPEQMPTRLEAGTLNAHGIAGLHVALRYLQEYGIDRIREEEQKLASYFYEQLRKEDSITFYGDLDNPVHGAIVTFNIGDYDSAQVSDELAQRFSICTRPGAHCAPLMHETFGTEGQGAVRFSFSHFHTMEEVRTAVEAIHTLIHE